MKSIRTNDPIVVEGVNFSMPQSSMTSHADTIRLIDALERALERSEAENQRLRDALEAFFFEYDSGKEYAHYAPSDPVEQKMREALAGDAELHSVRADLRCTE